MGKIQIALVLSKERKMCLNRALIKQLHITLVTLLYVFLFKLVLFKLVQIFHSETILSFTYCSTCFIAANTQNLQNCFVIYLSIRVKYADCASKSFYRSAHKGHRN